MLYSTAPIRPQMIVTQAVGLKIDDPFQPGFERDPLRRVDLDLKHGILHALAEIFSSPGHAAQAAHSVARRDGYIVRDQYEHRGANFQNQDG